MAVLIGALVTLSGLHSAANAQASSFLPGSHWARSALHRLAVTGTIDVAATALVWPASRADALEWLDTSRVQYDARARWYRTILEREHNHERPLNARLTAVGLSNSGALRAGTMVEVPGGYMYPGPQQIPNQRRLAITGELNGQVGGWLALGVQGSAGTDTTELQSIYLTTRVRNVDVWAGRRTLALGTAAGENLVLNEVTAFDGVGLAARRGVRVPLLGRIQPELVLARLERSGTVRDPWFHAARLAIVPAPSVVIGLNRAAIFGGEGHIGINARRIVLMLIGLPDVEGKDSDFENQVGSIDLLWRTRIGETPIGVYGEMAADDSGWAFVHVPGLRAGIEAGELPGLPELMLGLEIVHIAERCCNYPPWYQHGALADGWSDRGQLLGHSLGGAGTQLGIHWRIDRVAAPLMAAGALFVRERKPENLLAPLRAGRSAGSRVDLLVPWRRSQLQLRGEVEYGTRGWQGTNLSLAGHVFF